MITDNDKRFIGYAIAECAKEGVQVTFLPKIKIKNDNFSCAGYFNDGEKKLFVATKMPFKNFFPVFLHEFSHFIQWRIEEPSFMNINRHHNLDSDMWDWLEGKDIPIERVKKSIDAYKLMEINCDKQAVKFIDEFKLSINREFYIQAANVCALAYGVLKETRKWFEYSPSNDRLFDLVPRTFIRSFKLPKGFKKRIKSVCY